MERSLDLEKSLNPEQSFNMERQKFPIRTISIEEQDYPPLLRFIKDPPKLLYYRGNIGLAHKRCVSVVGSRHGTGYGKWAATMIGSKLAEYDLPLVSGMALGIDTHGHKGALGDQGDTIAVLGSGIDVCYPRANQALMKEIVEKGLVVSEYPPGFRPTSYSFPARNRLISGISEATVVVEAGLSSGSLITAEFAAEQGRNIYAVPGNINSQYSMGTNKLIKDGAIPLTVFEELLEDMGIARMFSDKGRQDLGNDERIILSAIEKTSESTVDSICRTTGKNPGQVNALITILEMKGLVHSFMGKIFIAK
jgi:DNA processing protein